MINAAFGNACRTSSTSDCVIGAEPVRTDSTDDRSVRARVSRSRMASASMVGTDVSQVTLNRPIASTNCRASNCGIQDDACAGGESTILRYPGHSYETAGRPPAASGGHDRPRRSETVPPKADRRATTERPWDGRSNRKCKAPSPFRRALRSDGLKGAEIKEACEAINPGGIEVDQRECPPVIALGQSHRKMQT